MESVKLSIKRASWASEYCFSRRDILCRLDCLADGRPGPSHNEGFGGGGGDEKKVVIRCRHKCCEVSSPTHAAAVAAATVVVHVDARFYLRGRKGGRRRERRREGEGSDSGCFKCVGFICGQSLRNHHHSRFSSQRTGWVGERAKAASSFDWLRSCIRNQLSRSPCDTFPRSRFDRRSTHADTPCYIRGRWRRVREESDLARCTFCLSVSPTDWTA